MWARVVVCKHARWRNPWWNPTRSQCKLGKWLNVASRRHHWWCRCYWSRLSSCVPSLFAWPHCSPGHISQDKVQEQTLSYVCIYVYIIVYIYIYIYFFFHLGRTKCLTYYPPSTSCQVAIHYSAEVLLGCQLSTPSPFQALLPGAMAGTRLTHVNS